MDYKRTMNLPQTDFPMKADLAKREPNWLEFWDAIDVYQKSLDMNAHGPVFILHDGPPYANGHIHMGTAFNKVLKDLVVKYKTMRGFWSPYVPGWDCHGQPIEHQVEKGLGPERMRSISQAELRTLCREYAMKFVDVQAVEFKRLGVRGDFSNPYLTLNPEYEAGNVKIFKTMFDSGMIYKGRKPIHWCVRCTTALAEAEIEYGDETSDSIYVAFDLVSRPKAWSQVEGDLAVLIWTTTPWTLPANVAVALAEEADYVTVRADGRALIVAEALLDEVAHAVGWQRYEVLEGRVKGRELAGVRYRHPIHTDGTGVLITGEHVDLSTGTGAVHTAPGHGEEDYLVGVRYDLPMPMPVDEDGVFDAGGGPFAGQRVWDANSNIVGWLKEKGSLVAAGTTSHSYPHCWRCKQPVIFRATEQWFVSMDKTHLRDHALRAVNEVEWIPSWSVNRISSMVADRPDWCISRQRAWGVPIPVFECVVCGETVATDETFDAVITLFQKEGADAWFTKNPRDYLPEQTRCPRCDSSDLKPESDILDVWWESGVSHTSVLEARPELRFPADMYLEGSDQHRGWFQSALLTSVGAYDRAPYESVLTHGFIVDGDGRKMSKSLGNVISPLDVVARSGADIIRLWVASADYSQDVSVSDEILDRTSEAYRRIRNTFRFLLGNLHDFEPEHAVAWSHMPELDRFALVRLADLVERVGKAYDEWKFHLVFHAVYSYAVTDLSAFYLDVLKDRLYSDAANSSSRRSAQTVLSAIATTLVRLVAPILVFTSEEVWQELPDSLVDAESVQLAGWPVMAYAAERESEGDALRESYAAVLDARDVVMRALEVARTSGRIGKSQEAKVVLTAPQELVGILAERGSEALAEMFIVAEVVLESGPELSAVVEVAAGEKCPRCWNIRDLGTDPRHPEVCARCAQVLSDLSD